MKAQNGGGSYAPAPTKEVDVLLDFAHDKSARTCCEKCALSFCGLGFVILLDSAHLGHHLVDVCPGTLGLGADVLDLDLRLLGPDEGVLHLGLESEDLIFGLHHPHPVLLALGLSSLHELLDEAPANKALSTHMICIIPIQDVLEHLAAELCPADEPFGPCLGPT